MKELISRQGMLNRLEEWNTDDPTDKALYNFAWNRIIEQPTIELRCEECEAFNKTRLLIPQPERKKGKWIMKYKGSAVTSYKCSECGRTVKDDTGYDVSKDYPFCHCGADMREDQDGKSD